MQVLIELNKWDGTYNVHLYRKRGKPININVETIAEARLVKKEWLNGNIKFRIREGSATSKGKNSFELSAKSYSKISSKKGSAIKRKHSCDPEYSNSLAT